MSSSSIVNALHAFNRFTRAVEGVALDTIAAVAPWLAPILPAFMTYSGMHEKMGFPIWVSAAGAGVVELLGLSSVSTAVAFWDFNDARRKSDQRAPVFVALITAGFYLSVVLTVNVLLDSSPIIYKVAKGLLSSLSVCAAMILALRAGHARRIIDIEDEKHERRELRMLAKENRNGRRKAQEAQVILRSKVPQDGLEPEENYAVLSENYADQSGSGGNGNGSGAAWDWRRLPEKDKLDLAGLSPARIRARYPGMGERTSELWAHRARVYANQVDQVKNSPDDRSTPSPWSN